MIILALKIMEKDQGELNKTNQMKFCRIILRAITKLMFGRFFKVEEIHRPKNVYNLLHKATDYLKLWYYFLQIIFEENQNKNNNKTNAQSNTKKYSQFSPYSKEEFNLFDIPLYLKRERKKLTLKTETATSFQSPRTNRKPEFSKIETFSDKIKSTEEEVEENALDLNSLTKFQKRFYCKEFIIYLLKVNICWCIYYEK